MLVSISLLLLAVAVSDLPALVESGRGGPVLLPNRELCVDSDGTVLRATLVAEVTSPAGQWVGAWATARGVLVTWRRHGSDPIRTRGYGQIGARTSAPGLAAGPASLLNPIGGPPEAGAVIAKAPGGPYFVIDGRSGTCRWQDGPPAAPPARALFLLPAGPALLESLDEYGRTDGRVLLAVSIDGRLAAVGQRPTASALPVADGLAEILGEGALGPAVTPLPSGFVTLGVEAGRVVGLMPAADGLLAPAVADARTGQLMSSARAWLEAVPCGERRRVARANGTWLEWSGLAVGLESADARLCWSGPDSWSPSPDGRWSAVLDAYQPANPVAWPDGEGQPKAAEVWLAVLRAGDEYDAPLRRAQARWAVCVSREMTAFRPASAPRAVWSGDGALLAWGDTVYAADKGTVVRRLPGHAPRSLAFLTDGRLLFSDTIPRRKLPTLYTLHLPTGQAEELALDRAVAAPSSGPSGAR